MVVFLYWCYIFYQNEIVQKSIKFPFFYVSPISTKYITQIIVLAESYLKHDSGFGEHNFWAKWAYYCSAENIIMLKGNLTIWIVFPDFNV